MSRLLLKFQSARAKEVPCGPRPVTIGRAPDNDIQIDNLAVSNYHARVYVEAGSLVVEDLNSLNGSFLNEIRVERAMLKNGDTILIGKHHIIVDQEHDAAPSLDAIRNARASGRGGRALPAFTRARACPDAVGSARAHRSKRVPHRRKTDRDRQFQ